MNDIIKLAKLWESGGTVENPKWLLRELIADAERLRELMQAVDDINGGSAHDHVARAHGGFEVTPEWCESARQSVEGGALEQLDRQQRELDKKRDFWRGYIAAIEELEEHIKRADDQ